MPSFYEEAAISSVYLHANTKHWQTTYTACIFPVFYWVIVHKYIYIYEFINIFSGFFNNLIKVHIPVNFYSCIAIAIYCLNYNFIFFNGSTQELSFQLHYSILLIRRLAQACSHIGALLFALSHAKPSKSSSESCTSRPCKWIIPVRQVKPTGPNSSLPNMFKGQLKESEDFTENLDPLAAYDPRHSDDRHLDLDRTLQHLQEFSDI